MTDTQDLFVAVDSDEVPAQDGRAKRYDPLIEACFASPGQWFKVNRTFTSKQTATNIRKAYENEVDTEGRTVHVRAVQQNGAYAVYVAVLPEDAAADTAS